MKLRLKQMITPICIVLMLVTQLVNYFSNGAVNLFVLATACFVSPTAIKELKPNFINLNLNDNLHNIFLIIGVVILSTGIYIEFIK